MKQSRGGEACRNSPSRAEAHVPPPNGGLRHRTMAADDGTLGLPARKPNQRIMADSTLQPFVTQFFTRLSCRKTRLILTNVRGSFTKIESMEV